MDNNAFTQQAQKAGYSSEQISSFIEKKNREKMNTFQKLVTNKNLPLYASMVTGAAATPVTGGLGAIPAAGLGAGAMYALQDLLRPFANLPQEYTPNQKLVGAGKEVLKGATSEAVGKGVGWVGGKVLGPVLSKVKIGSPKVVQESIEGLKGTTGKEIENIFKTAGDKPIVTQPILNSLNDLFFKTIKSGNEKASAAVLEAYNRVAKMGGTITPEIAHEIASGFAQEVYGTIGKEGAARGAAIAGRSAKKILGEGLQKEAVSKVPEVAAPMERYGQLAGMSREMQQPFKNWWMGGLAGSLGLGSAIGGNPSLLAPSTLVALMAMPYTRLMLRKLLGTGVKAAQYPAQASVYKLLGLGD